MDGLRRHALLLTICAGNLALGTGCHLAGRRNAAPALPVVLMEGASLAQVMDAVNNNSRQIRSFSTNQAELSGPGIPVTLRSTNIVFERPRRLRIQAGTMLGPELDIGSNDELFWFWIGRNEPPAVFFCRHDQYASCEAARRFPIEPNWLIEALGIVEFGPQERHQGPVRREDGRLEILTVRQTACGPATKKTVVDGATAVVWEQHLYDYQGGPVASVVVRQHRLDPLTNLVLPKVVDLQYPQAQFSMQVDLGNVTINGELGNPSALWSMPMSAGWPVVNLADPNGSGILGNQQPGAGSAGPVMALPRVTQREFNRLQ